MFFLKDYPKRRTVLQQGGGFTLIELSIVLVIIGLIVGGVLVGKDLIHAAKIRKTISDFRSYELTYNTFKLKYNAIPGDMENAYDFFGAECGNNTTHNITGCNGNGNKQIIRFGSAEYLKAWKHLSLAGLVPGTYTGVAGSPSVLEIGVNVPSNTLRADTLYLFSHYSSVDNGSYYLYHQPGNYVELARLSGGNIGTNSGIHPIDAYTIDMKFDDGLPQSGRIKPQHYHGCFNTSTNVYGKSDQHLYCRVFYYIGY